MLLLKTFIFDRKLIQPSRSNLITNYRKLCPAIRIFLFKNCVDFKKGEKEIINETLSYQYWMILQKDDPLYYYHWSRLKYFDPRFKDRLIKLDTFSSNLIRLELNENGFLSPLQKKIDREKRVQLPRLSYSSTNLRKRRLCSLFNEGKL